MVRTEYLNDYSRRAIAFFEKTPTMRTLLNILITFKVYVLLAVFIVVSLVLLAGNDSPQLKAGRATTVGFLGAIQDAVSGVPNVFTLQRENEILRELNVNLSDEVSRLREARIDNERLRAMLDLRQEVPFTLVAADVVGESLLLMRNTLTLNVGSKSGVAPDMPIISEQGLVGKVIAVADDYALGQILFNKDIRVAAKTQESSRSSCQAVSGRQTISALRGADRTAMMASAIRWSWSSHQRRTAVSYSALSARRARWSTP